MNKMIEKVAKAIREAGMNSVGSALFEDCAKAAIAAMLEPTDDMIVDMELAVTSLMCLNSKETSPAYIAYQAAITRALKGEVK